MGRTQPHVNSQSLASSAQTGCKQQAEQPCVPAPCLVHPPAAPAQTVDHGRAGPVRDSELVAQLCEQIRGGAPSGTPWVQPAKPSTRPFMKLSFNAQAAEFAPRGQAGSALSRHASVPKQQEACHVSQSASAPSVAPPNAPADADHSDPITRLLLAMVQQIGPLSEKTQNLVARVHGPAQGSGAYPGVRQWP
jgi:hypothetical protein